MRVLSDGKFSIYVYSETGNKHHLPHCHVRWVDGEAVVALPSLRIIVGSDLPRTAKELIRGNLEEIYAKWFEIN